MCLSIIAALSIVAHGLAIPFPAISGAVPCTGSKYAQRSPIQPEAANPNPAANPAPTSESISPNVLVERITSKCSGSRIISIAQASIFRVSYSISGYSVATDGNKSTDKELVNITFDVFVHVSHANRTGGGGLRFKFTEVLDRQAKPEQGRYGKHQFTVKCTEVTDVNTKDHGIVDGVPRDFFWDSEGIQSVTKKIKADTLYEVQALGSAGGKSIHQGLLKSDLGYGGEGISLEDEYDQQIGTKIFADLLSSTNDNDDIQIGAKKGKFTAEGKWYTSDGTTQNFPTSHLTHNSDGTWKEDFRTAGVDTYDLYYTVTRKELEDTAGVTDDLFATEQEGSVTQSFMNKYAISPVPMSNELGSDYANQLFTMEWDMLFPYPGEYTFIGQSDNECKFYLDGQLVGDLSTWNTAPWVLKKEMNWPTDSAGDNGKLHTIRLDLVNTPKVEGVVVQQKEGQTFVAEDSGDVFEDVTFDGFAETPVWIEIQNIT